MKKMTTWVPVDEDSDFSIYNLPYGIFSTIDTEKRLGVAIGDMVLDLKVMSVLGFFDTLNIDKNVFAQRFLNDFIRLGKQKCAEVRAIIQRELTDDASKLRSHEQAFFQQKDVSMHLPVQVGDYTDFYSSIEHATNVGKMFRDPENALLPNWRHLPVGYHGRASSIIESGRAIHRPQGQVLPKGAQTPVFKASERLDFELEMAFIIGQDSKLGSPVKIEDTEQYIFGKVLFNDWSARDIQKWEYVPLGPFLGKNFASSISPWVVTMAALEPFRIPGPRQEPTPLPYLQSQKDSNFDIQLEVSIVDQDGTETVVSESNFKYMYWSMYQQLAHHTVNGCNVNVGDMLASGTISGPTSDSYGSMLELSWSGTKSITLANGRKRTFLEDFDTVVMRGFAQKGEQRVGFGEVRTQILPAH